MICKVRLCRQSSYIGVRTLGPFYFLSLLKLERLRNGRGLQCSRRTRRHGGPDPGASDGEPAFAAGGRGARTASDEQAPGRPGDLPPFKATAAENFEAWLYVALSATADLAIG